MTDPALNNYSFTLPADEAQALDRVISMMQYLYQDMSAEDCLRAMVRIGYHEVAGRLDRVEIMQTNRRDPLAG